MKSYIQPSLEVIRLGSGDMMLDPLSLLTGSSETGPQSNNMAPSYNPQGAIVH